MVFRDRFEPERIAEVAFGAEAPLPDILGAPANSELLRQERRKIGRILLEVEPQERSIVLQSAHEIWLQARNPLAKTA